MMASESPDMMPVARRGQGAFIYFTVGFAAIGGILFGLDQGNWGGAVVKDAFVENFCGNDLRCQNAEELPRSYENFLSWGSSILQLGAALGAVIIAPTLAGRFGRRETMFAGCIVTILGVLPQCLTTNISLFLLGRALAGVGVGIVTYALPMFISEVAPSNIRGMLGCSMQLCCVVGSLIASLLNAMPEFGYQFSFSLPALFPSFLPAAEPALAPWKQQMVRP